MKTLLLLSSMLAIGLGTWALAEAPATEPATQSSWRQELLAGREAMQKAQYDQAEGLLKSARDSAEGEGAETLDAADAQNELGKLYRLTGQYDRADDLDHKALAIRRKLLGDNDPVTAVTLENLGELDVIRGKYKQADQELRRAMEIRKKVFGEQSAEAAESMTNLGTVDLSTCQYDEADKLCAAAVEIETKVLKADDPARANAWDNLANCYFVRGRLTDAEVLFKRALDLRTSCLGEDHPDVGGSYDNLGWLYLNWNDGTRARRYFKLAQFTRDNSLGSGHPDTVESHAMWVSLFDATQRPADETIRLLKGDLDIETKVLSADHMVTQLVQTNLADAYAADEKYDDAEKLLKEALANSRRAFGEEHVNTANLEGRLAIFYTDTSNNPTEAEKLFKEQLGTLEKVLGPDHRDVGDVLHWYAKFLKQQNRLDEEAAMEERAKGIDEDDQKRNPPDDLQGPGL